MKNSNFRTSQNMNTWKISISGCYVWWVIGGLTQYDRRYIGQTINLDVILKHWVNTLRPRQNGRHFVDDTFKYIFLNENVIILVKISLKFVPKGPINNIPALVQIMAWRRSGDKPLSEPMMVSLLTHICVTRPQWVKKQDFKDLPKLEISV